MLHPAFINILSYFYPLGNTSAICLTRDLPREQQGNILLLGCGDVRNILFTSYSDGGSENRRLDITCCDHGAAILARNVLLFTLIMDYADGSKDTPIWNIYYHLFLDSESIELLHVQTRKLYSLSASIQSWHGSKYGRLLRMCDQGTLRRVRKIWDSFDTSHLSGDDRTGYNNRFESRIQTARDMIAQRFGHGSILTGFRSAAPISIPSMGDLPDLFRHFWEYGITDERRGSLSRSTFPNPMFACSSEDASILHYGTDPLLGFHLGTAYASLAPGSPLEPSGNSRFHKCVATARLQFREWCVSFRKRAQKNYTIRFFAGDALGLCHTLQHMHANNNSSGSNWYRDQYHLEPLILDCEDYDSNGDAPLLFNVIDTSNLLDHLGAINILVAASPLLEKDASATLYTEALVKKEKDLKTLIETILCGHFPTLSMLFGLMPIEYWTNSTAISSVEEQILDTVIRSMGDEDGIAGQMQCRLSWKWLAVESAGIPSIHFDASELANILYQFYLNMFQNENMSKIISKIDLQIMQNNSVLHYHRGTLTSFLRLVKKRIIVEWNEAMNVFIGLVEKDSTLLMSRNYIQELYLQLHLQDLYTVPPLRSPFKYTGHSQALKGVGTWKEIPTAICITLKIPRASLKAITTVPLNKLGTPIVHCVLQASKKSSGQQWQNTFAVVQLAFGEIIVSGSRSDGSLSLNVSEDMDGWNGHSPLIVSFVAPSWVVLLEPRDATVAFGVQSTPQSSYALINTLGLEMDIYKTTLGNEDNVYLTRHWPNQSGHMSVCNFKASGMVANQNTTKEVAIKIQAKADPLTGQITVLIGRVDILSGNVKFSLLNGASVDVRQLSPCSISICIGGSHPEFHVLFPVPIQRSLSRIRIARKSSYVEVLAPMADPKEGSGFPHFMYPIFPGKHGPLIYNMPRLNLNRLPILDTSKQNELQWLITHTSLMLSSRERRLREMSLGSPSIDHKDVRINFKDSLICLFMHFTGLQGQKARVFGINNPKNGGVHVLVFVCDLRLDLENHTVVLDTAILPLHDVLMPKIRPFLERLTEIGLCNIQVDDDELSLWKQVIPVWVERCRQWEHQPSCAYLSKAKIPLSVELGQNPICSCGEGTLLADHHFDLPRWDLAAKYAVRAAISPSFSVPFVEQNYQGNKNTDLVTPHEKGCRVCGRGKLDAGKKGLLKCARCQVVRYCSVECQRRDWKEHKKICE